jgi:hypothetical protein
MTPLMIWLASIGVYTVGTAITARVLHIRHYTRWMRWKNACPSKPTKLYRYSDYGGSGNYTKNRSEVDLYEFIKNSEKLIGKELLPRGTAFLWPFFAPVWAAHKFCFPEPKIPDVAKIHELENL